MQAMEEEEAHRPKGAQNIHFNSVNIPRACDPASEGDVMEKSSLVIQASRARRQAARISQAAAMAARQRLKAASTPIIAADAARVCQEAADAASGAGAGADSAAAVETMPARTRWSATACS